jgi:hypothetical protein
MDFTGEQNAFLDLRETKVGGQKVEPLPAGEYLARISKAEVKNTKGNGKGISLSWQVIDGDYAGKYCSDFIMFKHSNPDVVKIGEERLKGILVSAGREPVVGSVSEFIGMKALIGTRLEEYEGKKSAKVTYYDKAPQDVQDQVL